MREPKSLPLEVIEERYTLAKTVLDRVSERKTLPSGYGIGPLLESFNDIPALLASVKALTPDRGDPCPACGALQAIQAEYVKCVNELDSIVERMKKVGSTIPRQTYTLDLSQREAWLSGLKGESARALSLLLDTLEDALDGGNTLTLIAPDGGEVEEETPPPQDPDERTFIGSGEVEPEAPQCAECAECGVRVGSGGHPLCKTCSDKDLANIRRLWADKVCSVCYETFDPSKPHICGEPGKDSVPVMD